MIDDCFMLYNSNHHANLLMLLFFFHVIVKTQGFVWTQINLTKLCTLSHLSALTLRKCIFLLLLLLYLTLCVCFHPGKNKDAGSITRNGSQMETMLLLLRRKKRRENPQDPETERETLNDPTLPNLHVGFLIKLLLRISSRSVIQRNKKKLHIQNRPTQSFQSCLDSCLSDYMV